MKTVVPWLGGKRRLIKHILPLFPAHTCYCEPFAGGAALYFAKEQAKVEVINDTNGELVNLYRVLKHHLEEFLRHFKWSLISRQDYLTHRQVDPATLTDIQRAERFYYLQKMAFGGRMTSPTFGVAATAPPRLNLDRIGEDLSMAHMRLSRTYIEHLDWVECIKRYDRPGTLFYLDPPYHGTAGYGGDFGLEQYDAMAELARTIQGRMIISVNDIPEMRKAFDGLVMDTVGIHYTVGGANRSKKKSQELIIKNW